MGALQSHLKPSLRQRVIEVPEQGDFMVVVTGTCIITHEEYSTAPFDGGGLIEWNAGRGKYIQQAIPDLSKEDREFLISGTSPKGWAQLFPPEEDQ
jgi:hypothetical protein